jgi:hypothetical protein
MNRIEELENLLSTALLQRKKARALKMPTHFIHAINADIRNWTFELAELSA